MKKSVVHGSRLAVLVALALAVMPWRGGSSRLIIYALMVLFIVYPEVFPRRRQWVREVGWGLFAFLRRR
jgi:hypothetical protein